MALPLPQPLILAQSLRTAADQCELLGNLPAVNSAQVLQDILETLHRIETRMDRIETRMDRIESRMDKIENRMGALEGRMGALEGRMSAVEGRMGTLEGRMTTFETGIGTKLEIVDYNAQARLYNSDLNASEQDLEPIKTWENVVAPGYPTTTANLSGLTATQMNALLDAYHLSTSGNMDAKRKRFRKFIGLSKSI